MDVFKEVVQALKPLGLPIYFATRKEKKPPCIIYNIVEYQGDIADSKEYRTEYSILINLLITEDELIEKKEEIKKALIDRGFIKNQIPNAFWETDLQVFNQSFVFARYKIQK